MLFGVPSVPKVLGGQNFILGGVFGNKNI